MYIYIAEFSGTLLQTEKNIPSIFFIALNSQTTACDGVLPQTLSNPVLLFGKDVVG